MNTQEKIRAYCTQLRVPYIGDNFITEAENAAKAKLSYQDFLLRLLEQQALTKIDTSINNAIKRAGFPVIKRLEEFDFTFQPQMDEKLIRELATLHFIKESKNVALLGPPGVGKTHLAISLGIKACQARKQVLFFTAEHLMQEMATAEISGLLNKLLLKLIKADLLIIDELGYIELSSKAARLFFKIISKRYETGSVIITSNKPFDEWGKIFLDDVLATAILDRVLHHCYPFFIQGKSYRMKSMMGKKNKNQTNKIINNV